MLDSEAAKARLVKGAAPLSFIDPDKDLMVWLTNSNKDEDRRSSVTRS